MSSGISFTCDSCGREVFGCNIVNGMKFCAKCYQETFGNQQNKESSELLVNSLAEKDRQITELKKQLEEKDADIIALDTDNYSFKQQIDNLKQQLKSQPAEIVEKIRKWGWKHYNWVGDGTGYDGQEYNECIGFNKAIDQLNEILDTILQEYQK